MTSWAPLPWMWKTTTMFGQKKVIELLESRGIRDNFKVILGGAPVNPAWVEESGADGYADNAIDAVKLVKRLINLTSNTGN